MTDAPTRTGVIGLGVGSQHAEAVFAHPECRLVAVADPDAEKLRRAAERWPGIAAHQDWRAITGDNDIEMVCVASPDDAHHGQIMASIEAGKHVFAEKPLCVNETQTRDIWKLLAERPQIRLSSNTVLRRSPRFFSLREKIADGALGEIFHIEADYNYGRLWKLTDGWRGRIPGYSVMLGGGIHMADLVMWLVGQRVSEVHACGNNIGVRHSTFAGNDFVVAILRFESGATGKIAANFGCVEPHVHRLLVYGTAATFENGRDCGWLYHSREPADKPDRIETAYPGVAKGALIPSFIDAIRHGGRPDVDENDIFDAMAVCHAVERSLRNGRSEPVDYFPPIVRQAVNA